VYNNVVGGSSMIKFPLLIYDSRPGIEPVPLCWHTKALTTELQEVREISCPRNSNPFIKVFGQESCKQEPWPIGWQTNSLTTELQEVRQISMSKLGKLKNLSL
jgi:hypothetical protein